MRINERVFMLRQEFFTPGREMFEVNRFVNEIIVKAAEGKKPTNEDVLKKFIEYISSIGTDRLQNLSYIFVDEVKEIRRSISTLTSNNNPISKNDFKWISSAYEVLVSKEYLSKDDNASDVNHIKNNLNVVLLTLKDFFNGIKFVKDFRDQMEYVIYMIRMSSVLGDIYYKFQSKIAEIEKKRKVLDSELSLGLSPDGKTLMMKSRMVEGDEENKSSVSFIQPVETEEDTKYDKKYLDDLKSRLIDGITVKTSAPYAGFSFSIGNINQNKNQNSYIPINGIVNPEILQQNQNQQQVQQQPVTITLKK
nr:MAG TPA: hypothetical protein [Caudoviricetes sp.]